MRPAAWQMVCSEYPPARGPRPPPGAIGCGGDRPAPTEADTSGRHGRPAFDDSGISGNGVQLSVSTTDQFAFTGTVSLPTYPYPTVVSITVSGASDAYRNVDMWSSPAVDNGDHELPFNANHWDPRGRTSTNGCSFGVYVTYNSTTTIPGGSCPSVPTAQGSYTWRQQVSGAGTASLQPTSVYKYNGVPIDRFEHNFQVTVTRSPAELRITADRYVVTAGHAVTFTAAASPSSDSLAFGLSGLTWSFVPDSGSAASTSGCNALATCVYTPTSSGTMTATGITNGVSKTSNPVHIRVPCAVTGDSLLDSLPILDALHAAMAASGDIEVDGNRIEPAGALVHAPVSARRRVHLHYVPAGGSLRARWANESRYHSLHQGIRA